MGADQFDITIEQDKKEAKQFFSYFYWRLIPVHMFDALIRFYTYVLQFLCSINLGALVAYTLVAYICQYGLPFLGGPKWGFFVGIHEYYSFCFCDVYLVLNHF